MTRPTWVLIVGVLLVMINGCGGIFADLKQIKTEALLEIRDELVVEITKEVEAAPISDSEREVLEQFTSDTIPIDSILTGENIGKLIKENTHMSESAISDFVKHGYMGLLPSILFLLFGLLMIFSNKPFVIKGTMILLILSLLFVVYQILDLRKAKIST